MATQIIRTKDHFLSESCNGGIREQTVIALPGLRSPLKPYSNLFYWSHHTSDYGCTIPNLTNIGFEMVTYVTKGAYDIFHKENDRWARLAEGDIVLVRCGKGIRYSEKLHPRSEILQVWFNPGLNQKHKSDAELIHCNPASFRVSEMEGKKTSVLGGKEMCLNLESDNVSIELNEYSAGFHTISCPENSVLSCHLLQGFMEIENVTLGKGDFFKIEDVQQVKVASLVNSKMFVTITPYVPNFKPLSSMRL